MSKRSPSFIKNKWVGAASQITRRTMRDPMTQDDNAPAASERGHRIGNVTPPEWREFSPEMINVLREIQVLTASNHHSVFKLLD